MEEVGADDVVDEGGAGDLGDQVAAGHRLTDDLVFGGGLWLGGAFDIGGEVLGAGEAPVIMAGGVAVLQEHTVVDRGVPPARSSAAGRGG